MIQDGYITVFSKSVWWNKNVTLTFTQKKRGKANANSCWSLFFLLILSYEWVVTLTIIWFEITKKLVPVALVITLSLALASFYSWLNITHILDSLEVSLSAAMFFPFSEANNSIGRDSMQEMKLFLSALGLGRFFFFIKACDQRVGILFFFIDKNKNKNKKITQFKISFFSSRVLCKMLL